MTTQENQEETLTVEQLQQQLEEERVARSKAEADAWKRKNRYKSSKAQVKEQKVSKSESEDDDDEDDDTPLQHFDDDVESRIEAKIEFYQSNPNARAFKDDIEGYVKKGLERDKAMKLVFADKDPELLRDPSAVNQENIGATAMQGQSAWAKKPISKESISEANLEELDRMQQELTSS